MRTNESQTIALDQLSATLFQEVVFNSQVPLAVRARVGAILRDLIPIEAPQVSAPVTSSGLVPIPTDFTARVHIVLEKDKAPQVRLPDILAKLGMPVNQGTLVATGRALAKLGYVRKRMSSKDGRYPIYIKNHEHHAN